VGGVRSEGTQPRRSYVEVTSAALDPRGRPHVPFQWNPNLPPIQALYDTGASPNCIRESIFNLLRAAGAAVKRLPHDDIRLNSASAYAMDIYMGHDTLFRVYTQDRIHNVYTWVMQTFTRFFTKVL
jgi:hypothetical protein